MYQQHWGLNQAPFPSPGEPGYFYEGPGQQEGLMRLRYLVEGSRRLGLLVGPRGGGKSLLLAVFGRRMAAHGADVALLGMRGCTPQELPACLLAELGGEPTEAPHYRSCRALIDRIAENRYLERRTILLLDDIDVAPPETVDFVLRLCEHDTALDALLTIVVTADVATWLHLGPSLLDRTDLLIALPPWHENETVGFIQGSLAQAGGRKNVFEPEAMARLHTLAGGLPRRVSQLAELALLAGAAQRTNTIDTETVDAVYEELHLAGAGLPQGS